MADDAITYAPNPAPAAAHHATASPPSIPSAPIDIPTSNRLSLIAHYAEPPDQHLPTSSNRPRDSPLPATGYGGTGLDDAPEQEAPPLPDLPYQPPNDNDPLPQPSRQPGSPVFCQCAAPALKTFRIRTTLRGAAIWARFRVFANTGTTPAESGLRRFLPLDRQHVVRVGEIADTQDVFAVQGVSWFGLCEASTVDPGIGLWEGGGKGKKRVVYEGILEGRGGYLGTGEMRLETVLARVVKCEGCRRVWEVRILK